MEPTERTRSDVWERLRDAEFLVRYYEKMAERAAVEATVRRRNIAFLAGCGFILGGVSPFPIVAPISEYLTLIAAVLVLVSGFMMGTGRSLDLVRKSIVLEHTTTDTHRLVSRTKTLWSDVDKDGAEDDDIRRRLELLEGEGHVLNTRVGRLGLTADKELSRNVTSLTHKLLEAKYVPKDERPPAIGKGA